MTDVIINISDLRYQQDKTQIQALILERMQKELVGVEGPISLRLKADFYDLAFVNWQEIWKAIPATIRVTSLDLSENFFDHVNYFGSLSTLFASIPASVTSLNLAGNFVANPYSQTLLYQNVNALINSFSSLKPNITELIFLENDLRCWWSDDLEALGGVLPHVQQITGLYPCTTHYLKPIREESNSVEINQSYAFQWQCLRAFGALSATSFALGVIVTLLSMPELGLALAATGLVGGALTTGYSFFKLISESTTDYQTLLFSL